MPIKAKLILNTIIQFGGIILLGYLFNRLIEVIVIIPLFFIFRARYDVTFHAKTVTQCTVYTLLMFLIISILAQPLSVSLYLLVILCYFTTTILHYIGMAIEYNKVKHFKIYVGMPEQILLEKCRLCNLTQLETDVLINFYCKRMKRWQIGNLLNYSEDNISKIKKKALGKLV